MRFRTIARIALALAVAAVMAGPTGIIRTKADASSAASIRRATANDGNNVLPGASLSPTATSVSGSVSPAGDPWDIYQLHLGQGEQLYLSFSGTAGKEAYAFLLPPKSTKVDPGQAVAMGVMSDPKVLYPQVMRFESRAEGNYSLVIFGNGAYTASWSRSAAASSADVPGADRMDYTKGSLSAATSWSDVYSAHLMTGQAISAELTKPASADFQLNLFGPDVSSVYFTKMPSEMLPWPTNAIEAGTPMGDTSQRLQFQAPSTGTYYLQTAAFSGSGDYELSTKIIDPSRLDKIVWDSPFTLHWSRDTTVTGQLLGSDSAPIASATVTLERWDQTAHKWEWSGAAATTDAEGAFAIHSALLRSERLRVHYAGQYGQSTPVTSDVIAISVYARLSKPNAPLKRRVNTKFTVMGTITPRHIPGTRCVTVQFAQNIHGKWVTRKRVAPKVFDAGNESRYTMAVSLPARGMWRIKTYHSGDHALSKSVPTYIRIY